MVSGAPVNVALSPGRRTNRAAVPVRAMVTTPGWAVQPATPGWSGQVQAGGGRVPGTSRCRTSWVAVRSVTQVMVLDLSVQMPPGACRPELSTGEAGSGLPAAGLPRVLIRSTLPASERGSAARPASPVATSSDPSTSTPSAPPLSVAPRGIPVSTGLAGSPLAIRTTRLSLAVDTYA